MFQRSSVMTAAVYLLFARVSAVYYMLSFRSNKQVFDYDIHMQYFLPSVGFAKKFHSFDH